MTEGVERRHGPQHADGAPSTETTAAAGNVDVIVLTAITLEFEAVLKVNAGGIDPAWTKGTGPNGLPVAFRTFQGKGGSRIGIAVAQAGDMGAVAATNALLPLVERYTPSCVAMSGVCAGRPGKTNLGDVVAAERLFFHDTGKQLPKSVKQDLKTYNLRDDWKLAIEHLDFVSCLREQDWWKQRPVPYEWQEAWILAKVHEGIANPASLPECEVLCPQWETAIEGLWKTGHLRKGKLLLTAKGARRIERVLAQHRGALPDLSPAGPTLPFKVHVAPMGSGNKVVEDQIVWSYVSDYMRKTLGLEMEAAALGALVHAQRDRNLDAVVMKGVMDFANDGRDDHFKEFAARASAECLIAFLRDHLGPGTKSDRDWGYLASATDVWSQDTRDAIGPQHLPRESLLLQLQTAVQHDGVVVLIGDSGAGKSALLKALLASHLSGPAYCLHASEIKAFAAGTLPHGLSRPLSEILPQQSASWALLAVDGVDRLAAEDEWRSLARILRAAGIGNASSPWRLILTCQAASWAQALLEMHSHGASLISSKRIDVVGLDAKELAAIAVAIPQIAPVLQRPDLRPLWSNLKLIDVLATVAAGADAGDAEPIIGESGLIRWFWERYLRTGGRTEQHSAMLQRLARLLGDQRAFALPLADLPGPDTGLLPSVRAIGVVIERDEAVRFSHDLYSDYARQRYLLAQLQADRNEEIRGRLDNPHWHRAIRLLGLHLLELPNEAEGVPGWRKLLGALGSGVGADLLLEAIAFAASPETLLERLRADLVAESGDLLQRFLARFVLATTLPDPRIEAIPGDLSPDVLAGLQAKHRIPRPHLWVDVLRWIVTHAEEVLSLAPLEFIRVADIWFGFARAVGAKLDQFTMAPEVGAMIVTLAERAADAKRSYASGPVRDNTTLYGLALRCGPLFRERVTLLARRLAGRVADPAPQDATPPSERPRPKSWPAYLFVDDERDPWPEGPVARIDETFERVALERPGADDLISLDLALAREVFLALLIEGPRSRRRTHYDNWMSKDMSLRRPNATYPPFYDFAPARRFLEADPERGIDFIITLVDFATDRWADAERRRGAIPESEEDAVPPGVEPPSVVVEIAAVPKSFLGDERVFWWSQGLNSPTAAAAALMALEEWLHARIASGQRTDVFLATLLEKSHSAAILGVLHEVALKFPALLAGPLEPLTGAGALYFWGMRRDPRRNAQAAMIAWMMKPSEAQQKALTWHSMPHRALTFEAIVPRLLVSREFRWPAVEKVREVWRSTLDEITEDGPRYWKEGLVALLSKENWHKTTNADGGLLWEYTPPPEYVERGEPSRQAAFESRDKMMFPFRCRLILDGKQEINEEELASMLDYAAKQPAEDSSRPWMVTLAAMRCGAAAVALKRFPGWLDSHPQWKQQCVTWMVEAVSSPPDEPLVVREAVDDFSWDVFCAEALPDVWMATRADPQLRGAIARLVGAPRNEAVKRLFIGLAARRDECPDELLRLLHLGTWFARLELLANVVRTGIAQVDIHEVFANFVALFVAGTLTGLPGDWIDLARAWPPQLERVRKRIRVRSRWDGFDEGYLVAETAWIAAEARRDGATRHLPLHLVERLGQLTLRRLAKPEEEGDPHESGVPYDSDRAFISLNALFIVNEPSPEVRKRLSMPWLTLPGDRHYWTEEFLEDIYSHGLDGEMEGRFFREALNEIFEAALPPLDALNTRRGASIPAVAGSTALLGCGPWTSRWSQDRAPLAESLANHWERWIRAAIRGHEAAVHFLRLIRTPAARTLRVRALTWLSQTSFDSWLDDGRARGRLLELLREIAGEGAPELKRDAASRLAFEKLLRALIDRQEPGAILLSEELASNS